jgi:PAS domain S-box-containing protein
MRSLETADPMGAVVAPEALLDAMIDLSDQAVLVHDADGDLTAWTPTAERLFGYLAGEILGRPLVSLFARHEADDLLAVMRSALAGDSVTHYEAEALRKDGMPVPTSLSVCPLIDEQGVAAALVVVRDITEQRLAQATMAEVEARVRESEAMARVGSWLWDVGSATVQWSDECYHIHGVEPLSFAGTFESHVGVIHPDDRARVRTAMTDAVATTSSFEGRYRVVRPDGAVCEVQSRAEPTVGSDDTVLGLRGIVHALSAPG